MNFSEQWDKKENNSIRFNSSGLQIDVEIGGFSLRPEEYVVVMRDKERKPFDITMESPEPARAHTKGGMIYKSFGIDRCPACAGPYEPPKIGSIEKLKANLETTVECGFCKYDNVYFNKGRPVKLGKVTDFLDRRFIKPILKQKQ